jgi:purine-binding chemotaxis protein CheW
MTGPKWDPGAEIVLRRRAEQLARRPSSPDTGDEVEVVVCRLGTERYAVESKHLRAVQWVSDVTPVPNTPAFVVGIVSVRGELITLLDLASMIELGGSTGHSADDTRPVLLLGLIFPRAGLVVDEVLGVERLKLNSLQPSLSGREFARGVGPSNTVLLDLEALLNSGRFKVSDER